MSKRTLMILAGLVATAAFTAACGGPNDGANSPPMAASGGPVATSAEAGLGPILVDGTGKTLYFAEEERGDSIKCTGECLGFWTPLSTSGDSAPKAPAGLRQTLSTVNREDGVTQVTYNGHPLYTFKLDESAGDTAGNNFTDDFGGTDFTWHAITTDGTSAPTERQASPSRESGPGYGY